MQSCANNPPGRRPVGWHAAYPDPSCRQFFWRTTADPATTRDRQGFAGRRGQLNDRGRSVPASCRGGLVGRVKSELLGFPNARYYDQVDALAQLLTWIRSKEIWDSDDIVYGPVFGYDLLKR